MFKIYMRKMLVEINNVMMSVVRKDIKIQKCYLSLVICYNIYDEKKE